MANPQKENGYTPIAHTILEALATHVISPDEWRVLMVIFRKTYGWHKKIDRISTTQFQQFTGLKRRHVSRTLSKLVERKIVTRIGDGRIITYGFQKDYTKWKDVTKRGDDVGLSRVSGPGYKKIVTRIGDRSSPKGVHTKETNKRDIYDRSKKKETDPRVLEFINYWGETFKQETGKPYFTNYGKDGFLVKKIFQAGHSLEDIQGYAKIAFKDEQCKRRGLTIGIFSQELNRLVGLKAMNPLEQARRELRKGN
jgi:phage replication O-like protein O